jgi:hypothetical protein
MADLYPRDSRNGSDGNRQIVAEYGYHDENGVLLFQCVRYEPKDFRQRAPKGSDWEWKLNGVRRVLYRLPELLKAGPSELVFIVEGEKDVDRLRSIGLVATCNVGGAGKWKPEYNEHLRGRRIAVIPDNDEQGRIMPNESRNPCRAAPPQSAC